MRSWLSHKELVVVTADLKKSFLKKGIKKILLLISKNCLRHDEERHFFHFCSRQGTGRIYPGLRPPSALGAAGWPWQHHNDAGGKSWHQPGMKGPLLIPSSSMGMLPAASRGEGSG